MPFHGHHQSHDSQADPSNPHGSFPGILQTAQNLSAVGVTTSTAVDGLVYTSSGNVPHDAIGLNGGGYTTTTRPNVDLAITNTSSQHLSIMASSTQQAFDATRRPAAFARQPEELHIPPSGNTISSTTPRQQHHQQPSAGSESGPNNPLSINIQQSASQHPQFGSSSSTLPGVLQPGTTNRPPPFSANTAPSALPTLPQLSTQPQQTTPRSTAVNHAPSHSRSSPTVFDQPKYKYEGTPDNSKYASPPGPGYLPHTPQGAKYSPLGLADIRPPTDSLLVDTPITPNAHPFNGEFRIPKNSNYVAPWPIYAVDWCKWQIPNNGSFTGKVAIGSYLEDSHNYIQIIDTYRTQPDPDTPELTPGDIQLEHIRSAEATHSYPVTRILWEPPSSQKQSTDLLATSGDHLRLWSLPNTAHTSANLNSITRSSTQRDPPPVKLSPLALLSNSKSPEHTAPITALDWNIISPSLIITSSIDTTCTIWDIPTLTAKTQLIAHDKEVYDVRFCANSVDVFVSCGADGSVRMFDLRSLEHSTIIYEPSEKNEKLMSPGNSSPSNPHQPSIWPPPLLRIATSPHDTHLLATFSQDSNIIRILDVRQPGQALLELKGHSSSINCIEWALSRRGTLASGADDCLVLVWDLINQHNAAHIPSTVTLPSSTSERGPAAVWQCDYEISNLSWSPQGATVTSGHPREWLGVCGGKGFWGVAL